MTEARQNCSCRGYNAEALTLDILPWRRFPLGTSACSVGNVLLNRPLRLSGVPEHTGNIPHKRRAALPPALTGGASAPQRGEACARLRIGIRERLAVERAHRIELVEVQGVLCTILSSEHKSGNPVARKG